MEALLKIYKLERTDTVKYDEFEAFIVIASSEDDARSWHPEGEVKKDDDRWPTWTNDPSKINVVDLGIAKPGSKPGVVLTNFNAG